jgi:hypothetical protein
MTAPITATPSSAITAIGGLPDGVGSGWPPHGGAAGCSHGCCAAGCAGTPQLASGGAVGAAQLASEGGVICGVTAAVPEKAYGGAGGSGAEGGGGATSVGIGSGVGVPGAGGTGMDWNAGAAAIGWGPVRNGLSSAGVPGGANAVAGGAAATAASAAEGAPSGRPQPLQTVAPGSISMAHRAQAAMSDPPSRAAPGDRSDRLSPAGSAPGKGRAAHRRMPRDSRLRAL